MNNFLIISMILIDETQRTLAETVDELSDDPFTSRKERNEFAGDNATDKGEDGNCRNSKTDR